MVLEKSELLAKIRNMVPDGALSIFDYDYSVPVPKTLARIGEPRKFVKARELTLTIKLDVIDESN